VGFERQDYILSTLIFLQYIQACHTTKRSKPHSYLRDTEGNEIEVIIICLNIIAKVDKIVKDIREGVRDSTLLNELCDIAVDAVGDKTLADETCDEMIEKVNNIIVKAHHAANI
jgi:hypothetical protein